MADDKEQAVLELIQAERRHMIEYLRAIKKELEPRTQVDVRLCIDFVAPNLASWTIRHGDASFDQSHSELCGSSSVDRLTLVTPILEDLIEQCLEQLGSGTL